MSNLLATERWPVRFRKSLLDDAGLDSTDASACCTTNWTNGRWILHERHRRGARRVDAERSCARASGEPAEDNAESAMAGFSHILRRSALSPALRRPVDDQLSGCFPIGATPGREVAPDSAYTRSPGRRKTQIGLGAGLRYSRLLIGMSRCLPAVQTERRKSLDSSVNQKRGVRYSDRLAVAVVRSAASVAHLIADEVHGPSQARTMASSRSLADRSRCRPCRRRHSQPGQACRRRRPTDNS